MRIYGSGMVTKVIGMHNWREKGERSLLGMRNKFWVGRMKDG